jgi:hypothetical protein
MELLMDHTIWNAVLSLLTGLLLWLCKIFWDELQRVQILLNRTREEIARDNVTQNEIDKIVAHIDARFDKLNDKIDAFIKESRSAL